MKAKKKRAYDKEFKLNAVQLYLKSNRSYRELGKELGIPVETLSGWIKSYKADGKEAFPGKGHVKASDEELVKLRKELAIAREERDILKKAVGIFSLPRK
jgi:transposase-like protein